MSSVVLVCCSNCFKRSPFNPNKHKNRDVRYCPFCKTPYKIKRRFKFLPNLKWPQQKAEAAEKRILLKEMRRPSKQISFIPRQIPESMLALSMLIRQREMELKEEQAKKSEKSNS